MNYFKVRNFEKFQHYSNRTPPWVKLYRNLWQDLNYFRLKSDQKLYIIGFFTIASETENKIPADAKWIKSRLLIKQPPDFKVLLESGFIEPIDCDASAMLASCYCRVREYKEENIKKRRGEADSKAEAIAASQASPPTESKIQTPPKENPKDEAYETFSREFTESRQTPYRSTRGDFVQLAGLRKALNCNGKAIPDRWLDAIRNYLSSPLSKYTLADLCNRFDVFVLSEVDRFGKPVGFNDLRQENRKTIKSMTEGGFFE